MDKPLLGIDLGTSGVKVGIYSGSGRLLGFGRASSYTFYSPKPGWAQSDPEKWWHAIACAIRMACLDSGVAGHDIGAVGVSVFFPTVIPMDSNGEALYPGILYNDQRSLAQVDAIEQAVSREEYQDIIGNVLVPGTCAVTSMAWLRDEEPGIYSRAAVLGFANTYVNCKLTGEMFTDPVTVSISGLVDINHPWRWSEPLCEKLSIAAERLPKVAGAADVIGTVARSAASETGLKVGTPVVCGCGDAAASAVGAGAVREGTVVDVAGTTDCVTMPLSKPTKDRRWINCAFICKGTWFGIGSATSSGISVEWFEREFAPAGRSQAGSKKVPISQIASAGESGNSRLIYLPYLQGERTPVWDPRARGLFVGLSVSTTLSDMALAVLEGTAFAFRDIIDCLQKITKRTISEIRVVGGGTRNELWMQTKADVLGRALDLIEFQETGSLGAALLAGLGAGVYRSLDEAAGVVRETLGVRRIEPNLSKIAPYSRLFAIYKKLYPQTVEIMHSLSNLSSG